MPRDAFADTTTVWEALAASLRKHFANFPRLVGFEDTLVELEAELTEARQHKFRLIALKAEMLETSRLLQESLARGREVESRLRSLLKGQLGATNLDLIRFGLRPRRDRRHQAATEPQPTETPAASGSDGAPEPESPKSNG
jgi:hypothetical protein